MAGHLSILSDHALEDMTARYLTDTTGRVGLWLFPAKRSDLAKRHSTVANERWARANPKARPVIVVEPLVHVELSGDE
jgi:hypothetical protein